MHAQASTRKTQKIRQTRGIEAVEDPTLRFFLEGDALEAATQRAEAERSARERGQGFAGSFGNDNGETLVVHRFDDRRPTYADADEPVEVTEPRRGPVIALAGIMSLLAISVAAWMWMTPPVRSAMWWMRPAAPTPEVIGQSTPAPSANTGLAAPRTASVVPIPPAPEAAATGSSIPTATTETAPASSSESEPRAAAKNVPVAPASTADDSGRAVRGVDERSAEPRSRRDEAGRGHAARGYVWSPAAKALVPADSASPAVGAATPVNAAPAAAAAAQAPATVDPVKPAAAGQDQDAVMAPTLSGPGIAPASTGAAPDETARVPTTEPEPFEPAKQPEKPSAPIID